MDWQRVSLVRERLFGVCGLGRLVLLGALLLAGTLSACGVASPDTGGNGDNDGRDPGNLHRAGGNTVGEPGRSGDRPGCSVHRRARGDGGG